MSTSHAILKLSRKVHLYIGVFISPALLFFAFTGALQSFSLHEKIAARPDYNPPKWAMTLAQIHKKQTDIVPPKKPRPDEAAKPEGKHGNHDHGDASPGASAANAAAPQKAPEATASPAAQQKSHLPLKLFFLLVSIGLFVMTLTGIYMSYKYTRNTVVITALLIAGVIVPILLLPF